MCWIAIFTKLLFLLNCDEICILPRPMRLSVRFCSSAHSSGAGLITSALETKNTRKKTKDRRNKIHLWTWTNMLQHSTVGVKISRVNEGSKYCWHWKFLFYIYMFLVNYLNYKDDKKSHIAIQNYQYNIWNRIYNNTILW